MAKSTKYYNVDDFNEYKRKLGKCVPPRTNVIAAACYLQSFLNAKKFILGFMGGLPMLCLGYKREMPDLHIAYDDKDFERLRSKLESDQRYASVSFTCSRTLIIQDSVACRRQSAPSIQNPFVDWSGVQRS